MDTLLAFFLWGSGVAFLLGYPYIFLLKYIQTNGQPIREDGPKHHISKTGTPTMGGVLIIVPVIFSFLFARDLWGGVNLGVLVVFLGYAVLGAFDDLKKIIKRNSYGGMTPRQKLYFQVIVAFIGWLIVHFNISEDQGFTVYFPGFNAALNLGYVYVLFAAFIVVGASNAVNLTDGLDGLVTVPVISTLLFFLLLILWIKPSFLVKLTEQEMDNLAHLIVLIIGACLGFLYFNLYPAKIFMGDVGSLALGGLLGIISVVLKAEVLLAIAGLVFVVETISVMIQIFHFRRTGKRFFKMAPIHHHFEYLGWSEVGVVKLFWIVAAISSYIALGISALGNRL